MTITDQYGNTQPTSSPSARDAYDIGLRAFLGSNYGAIEVFTEAVNNDPGFALGHAARARALMMGGDMPGAKSAIATARTLTDGLTTREQAHIDVLSLLLDGKPDETRAAVVSHVREHPRDVLMAQLCTNVFGLIGFSGKVGREAELLAYTSALLPHYGEDWWMMSMHALSLCETGQIDTSTTLMEKSLALNPRNANGSHFKAHALYEAGETEAGRAYLDAWMPGYDRRSLLHGHLSWHQALLALADGDTETLWRTVDEAIAPDATHSLPINVLTDTAAIYHRASLAGIPVTAGRWADLSDYAIRFFPDPGQSFADIHAALGHAMAGHGDRLAKIAETRTGYAADLVAPLARCFGNMARENWQEALEDITPVMATHERLGGSRAQRDLIELTYVHLLLRLDKTDEARRTLAIRRPALSESPPLAYLN